jgi:arylformamidase
MFLVSEKMKESRYCKSLNIRYGPGDRQLMDIYENSPTSEHTFVYIHGGYWQELNKDISAYCTEPLVNAGIRVIIPGYDLAPLGIKFLIYSLSTIIYIYIYISCL